MSCWILTFLKGLLGLLLIFKRILGMLGNPLFLGYPVEAFFGTAIRSLQPAQVLQVRDAAKRDEVVEFKNEFGDFNDPSACAQPVTLLGTMGKRLGQRCKNM